MRVTCLEVLKGGAPAQVEAYRREVNELQELVKNYLSEVRELRVAALQGAVRFLDPAPAVRGEGNGDVMTSSRQRRRLEQHRRAVPAERRTYEEDALRYSH